MKVSDREKSGNTNFNHEKSRYQTGNTKERKNTTLTQEENADHVFHAAPVMDYSGQSCYSQWSHVYHACDISFSKLYMPICHCDIGLDSFRRWTEIIPCHVNVSCTAKEVEIMHHIILTPCLSKYQNGRKHVCIPTTARNGTSSSPFLCTTPTARSRTRCPLGPVFPDDQIIRYDRHDRCGVRREVRMRRCVRERNRRIVSCHAGICKKDS